MGNTKYPHLRRHIISSLGYTPMRDYETTALISSAISEALGYMPASQTQVLLLFQELAPDIVISSSSYELQGSEAIITVAATGGLGGLSYSLGAESNTTGIFTVTEPGTYTIYVVDGVGNMDSVNVIVSI